jgi:hypothetical protein
VSSRGKPDGDARPAPRERMHETPVPEDSPPSTLAPGLDRLTLVRRLAVLLLLTGIACSASSKSNDDEPPTCGPTQTQAPAVCDPYALDASMDCTGCNQGAGFACTCSPGAAEEMDGGAGWVCVGTGQACQ